MRVQATRLYRQRHVITSLFVAAVYVAYVIAVLVIKTEAEVGCAFLSSISLAKVL